MTNLSGTFLYRNYSHPNPLGASRQSAWEKCQFARTTEFPEAPYSKAGPPTSGSVDSVLAAVVVLVRLRRVRITQRPRAPTARTWAVCPASA